MVQIVGLDIASPGGAGPKASCDQHDPVDYLAHHGFSLDRVQRTKLGVIEAVVARRT